MSYLVTGEALIDFIGQGEDGTFTGLNGGSSFNVAVGLARLQQNVDYFTGLSTDMFGKQLLNALKAESVSTDAICIKDNPSTLAFVTMDSQGVPSYAFYGDGAADRALTQDDWGQVTKSLAAKQQDDTIRFVHFGSYSIVAPPTSQTLLSVAEHMSDCFINLDPNIRPTIQPDMQVWRDAVAAYLPFVSSIKISTEDVEAAYPDTDFKTLAAQWIDAGVKLVCVTDGEKGAHAFTQNTSTFVPAQKIGLVDTVGAGDTFSAALLYYLGQHTDARAFIAHADDAALQQLLSFCVGAAGITCSRAGADLPRLPELV